MKFLGKMWVKRPGLHALSVRYILKKSSGESDWPSSLLRVKKHKTKERN